MTTKTIALIAFPVLATLGLVAVPLMRSTDRPLASDDAGYAPLGQELPEADPQLHASREHALDRGIGFELDANATRSLGRLTVSYLGSEDTRISVSTDHEPGELPSAWAWRTYDAMHAPPPFDAAMVRTSGYLPPATRDRNQYRWFANQVQITAELFTPNGDPRDHPEVLKQLKEVFDTDTGMLGHNQR